MDSLRLASWDILKKEAELCYQSLKLRLPVDGPADHQAISEPQSSSDGIIGTVMEQFPLVH